MKLKMANKIIPISKTKIVDYSNEPLTNFWQAKGGSHSTNLNFKQQIIELLQSVTEGTICIQSVQLSDKQIIKQIFDTTRGREVKIYILVNQYSPELDLLNGVCLIRYDLENTGSYILANPNSKQTHGLFFTGQITDEVLSSSNQILKNINEKEITDLFRHFCFHFWETAKKEVIEKKQHLKIESKPIDIFHDLSEFGDKDFVYSSLFDFIEKTKRGELSNKIMVPYKKEKDNPILIKCTDKHLLGNIETDELMAFNQFENYAPDVSDNGTCCKIEYEWTNIPFYLPEKSNESPLYEKWKTEISKIKNHIETVLNKIQEAEKKEKTISSALSRFFLGKKTIFNKLKTDLEDIKQTDFPNITDKELKEKILAINEIYSQVENEIGEIEQEDKKAKLDDEINDLKDRKKSKEKELTNKQGDMSEKQNKINEQLKKFLAIHKIEESLIGKIKSDWQQQSGAKNKKDNPREAEEAEAKITELNEIQKQVFINKVKSEIENIQKEIKMTEDEIKRKENEKSKSSQQNGNKSSLSEFVANESSKLNSISGKQISIPDIPPLPKVGILYELNSKSYLAIEYWEQYEQGILEADRLKAKLCAIKN
jgi:hypothetical protein